MFHAKHSLIPRLVLLFAFLAAGLCWPSQALVSTTTPIVTTNNASDVEADSATLNADVESLGGAGIEEYGFCFGTDSSCSNQLTVGTSDLNENDVFNYDLSSLESNTTYYYMAYAQNEYGIAYGSVKSFTTYDDKTDLLEVNTNSASSIGGDSATLNAQIDSLGGADLEEYGFYYGTTTSCVTKITVGSTQLDEGDLFDSNLSGLDSNTKYYYMAYAQNEYGIAYGSVKSFTTYDEDTDKPSVTTYSASDIGDDSATLNAELDSAGGSAVEEYGFYYGFTPSCSTRITIGTSDLDDGDEFDYDLSTLDSDTKYYFMAYAKNDYGIAYGSIYSFTTDDDNEDEDEDTDKPSVTTYSASDIGDDSATLNAELDSVGEADIEEYGFYYGTTSYCSAKITVGTSDLDDGDEFDYDLSSLYSDTKYYFMAYAKNDYGTAYGSVYSFTTDDDDEDYDTDKPSVTTKTPSIGDDYATLYGIVTSRGDSSIESYGFYYGTSSSPGTRIEVDDSSIAEDETFSYKLTGLSPETTYYVQAYARNDDGTSYGSVLSFTISSKSSPVQITSDSPSVLTIGSKNYSIKGINQTGDVAPYIKDSRTFLPIRPVAYALGISDSNIIWDAATRTVTLTKESRIVKLTINNKYIFVNGMNISMDTAPEITAGRTCLPVAMVAQVFGFTASWDAATQSVIIK